LHGTNFRANVRRLRRAALNGLVGAFPQVRAPSIDGKSAALAAQFTHIGS
jgi:hypothetical protein